MFALLQFKIARESKNYFKTSFLLKILDVSIYNDQKVRKIFKFLTL